MGCVRVRCCKECRSPLAADADYRADFCGTPCRNSFNNRRMRRGAELYDLFMSLRYERTLAKTLKLWSTICALAQRWREEDREAGRKSWKSPHEVLNRR